MLLDSNSKSHLPSDSLIMILNKYKWYSLNKKILFKDMLENKVNDVENRD